jgi:molybdenum cofactor synthesis domain-containing protein
MRVGVLTVSDRCARGEREDRSGERIVHWCEQRGHELAVRDIVVDETAAIVPRLLSWADDAAVDVILTTGGTGLTSRDVTPEATGAVLERHAPGIAEALRMTAYPRLPAAALSRGLAGVRGRTLIVNLPGSPGGVGDGLAVLAGFVDHAGDLLRDLQRGHP